MKARKTRIKIEAHGDGSKTYTPQSRVYFSWYDFDDLDGQYSLLEMFGLIGEPVTPWDMFFDQYVYTLEGAQRMIDAYLSAVKQNNDKAVTKSEFANYP